MKYETEEEFFEEILRRIELECKQHHWTQLKDPGVFRCAICESLLFNGEDNNIELFMKYLTD
jgi:hypothetical protein